MCTEDGKLTVGCKEKEYVYFKRIRSFCMRDRMLCVRCSVAWCVALRVARCEEEDIENEK